MRVGLAGVTVIEVRVGLGFVGGGVDGEWDDDPPQLQKTSKKRTARDVVRMRRRQRTAALRDMHASNDWKLTLIVKGTC
jgi:hypothetical protein